jgi:hypothetical protein
VLDLIAVVAAWQLDYLVKTDVVELANFLPVDPVDLSFPSLIAVLSLVRGFGLSHTLVFAKDYSNGLLARGMACCEVEQLLRHPWLATCI